MSTMIASTPPGPTHDNGLGIQVPVSLDAHLQWWLEQIPKMETGIKDPTIGMFMTQCMAHDELKSPVPEELRGEFLLKVCEKRMLSLGLIASPWLNVLISGLCDNPAKVVMWCYFLKMHSVTINSNLIQVSDLPYALPNGVPSDAGLRWMWNLQKIPLKPGQIMDNLLDCVTMKRTVANEAG